MTTKVKTILVGAGKVGAGFADDPVMARHYPYASHAQVLGDHPAIEWGAVVDLDPAVTARVQERWKVPHAGASAKACAYDAELAVIATPPSQRIALLDELPALKAVLVEKPLGNDEAEARAFLDACAKRNILVQVNLWRRADPVLRDLRTKMLETIGELQTAFVVYGNGLHNNGTHMIDMVRMLFGPITKVRSAPESLRDAHGPLPGDVHVSSMLTLASGAVVHLAALDFRKYRENGCDVWGTAGRFSIWQEGLETSAFHVADNRAMQGEREIVSDEPRKIAPSCGRAFYSMYDNLLAAMRGSEELVSTGDSALATTHAVDMVERSAREGGIAIAIAKAT